MVLGHAVSSSPAVVVAASTSRPSVVTLTDPAAAVPGLVGAKAANLARAVAAGLPVLPGFAITTAASRNGVLAPAAAPAVRAAWDELSRDGQAPVVVRSSSTAEDTETSSMAGQFTSILDVRGWAAFTEAVSAVLASAAHPHGGTSSPRPMGVLVQEHLDPDCGGVLFGLDPVSGDRRHVIVEVVPGSPDALVSGRVTATHVVLGWRGRLAGGGGPALGAMLGRDRRRRLRRLAALAERAFAGPQDVEWAFDRDDRLWLLQSRAVTAVGGAARATGPVLGPGPVAETFPDPLRPLEVDLWVEPLRQGVAAAIHVTGARSQRRIDRSPVVCAIDGRVAVDLELFGIVPERRSTKRVLHPLRAGGRLLSAWRVGRLRAALPGLAADLLAQVDDALTGLGELSPLADGELVELLERAVQELQALHGHEVLAGMLLDEPDRPSLASVALAALAASRSEGEDDEQVIGRAPVVLALVPPALGRRHALPTAVPAELATTRRSLHDLGSREALRLRCRWVQELTVRVAEELGRRLQVSGRLPDATLVRELHLGELRATLLGGPPADLAERAATRPGPSLPLAFRLGPAREPVAEAPPRGRHSDGLPASSGRAAGVACHDPRALDDEQPSVLIVDTLDPRLASVLPRLAGLVSETGSALSHLAILARELRVPAVVAVPDARRRFPEGTTVLVDGSIGEVRRVHEEGQP
jgi:pyruvate,water dikinase